MGPKDREEDWRGGGFKSVQVSEKEYDTILNSSVLLCCGSHELFRLISFL